MGSQKRRRGWAWKSWGRSRRAEWRGEMGARAGVEGRLGRRRAARQPGWDRRRLGTPGSGPSRGPAPARPPTWARWTHSSRSHQPDSPRGRLRRQTAMHRAPPPAPAPQPACAIARPPARSLPRAISRLQGLRNFPFLSARLYRAPEPV